VEPIATVITPMRISGDRTGPRRMGARALSRGSSTRDADLGGLSRCPTRQCLLRGTLNQHIELDEGAGHPQWDTDGHERTHEVNVVRVLLSSLYPKTVGVNSLHHQTLAVLGNDLVASATAPTGWSRPSNCRS